jgi:hypothetical protein
MRWVWSLEIKKALSFISISYVIFIQTNSAMTTHKMYQTKCGHSQFVDLNSEFKDLQKFAIEPKEIT